MKSHSVQKVGSVEVEFGCVGKDTVWGFKITGMDYVKVEVVGERDQGVPFVERERLPKDFGMPKALRIYPRQ